jgi:D-arabinose 5-phosphate isomerase GutQ
MSHCTEVEEWSKRSASGEQGYLNTVQQSLKHRAVALISWTRQNQKNFASIINTTILVLRKQLN